jgi:hypothetical protein
MQFQAESLAQALRLAEAKAQELVRSVPESLAPQLESHSYLLLLDVQKVLRQAIALQQLASLPKVAPLMEPPHLSPQAKAQALVEGVQAQAEVAIQMEQTVQDLKEQAKEQTQQLRELVEVPLLEEE